MAVISPFDSTTIQQHQLKDTNIKPLYDKLTDGDHIKSLELQNGVIHKNIQRRGRAKSKLALIPTSMVKSLLEAYHGSSTSDIIGQECITIKQHVLSCTKCQQFKLSRTRPTGRLQPIEPPTGVLDLMGLDFIGPLPSSVAVGTYVNEQQSDWDDYLPFVTFAYNTSK
ncbi:unnamed protein product [Didymodactylos carnosus]|nr:unnamed protein product [Didymodactylos carnosus]CAF3979897.1 unnamed protein product [Didymodactylos carnosus]